MNYILYWQLNPYIQSFFLKNYLHFLFLWFLFFLFLLFLTDISIFNFCYNNFLQLRIFHQWPQIFYFLNACLPLAKASLFEFNVGLPTFYIYTLDLPFLHEINLASEFSKLNSFWENLSLKLWDQTRFRFFLNQIIKQIFLIQMMVGTLEYGLASINIHFNNIIEYLYCLQYLWSRGFFESIDFSFDMLICNMTK